MPGLSCGVEQTQVLGGELRGRKILERLHFPQEQNYRLSAPFLLCKHRGNSDLLSSSYCLQSTWIIPPPQKDSQILLSEQEQIKDFLYLHLLIWEFSYICYLQIKVCLWKFTYQSGFLSLRELCRRDCRAGSKAAGEAAEQQEIRRWTGAYQGKDHILHALFFYLFPIGCVRDTHPD